MMKCSKFLFSTYEHIDTSLLNHKLLTYDSINDLIIQTLCLSGNVLFLIMQDQVPFHLIEKKHGREQNEGWDTFSQLEASHDR